MLAMATPEIETARELATHASDIKHLQDDMDSMVADIAAIRKSLEEINTKLASAEGGWKVLIAVGSIVGSGVGAVIGFFTGRVH
jgi:prefoldin subunit 5